MKSYDLDSIVKLNKDFYELNASSFSVTRQSPWQGWAEILPLIKEKDTILDLGCGNGRFYKYLDQELKTIFTYTGLDNSEQLIEIAKKLNPEVFEVKDVVKDLSSVVGKFNFIVAFGILHHIPTAKLRAKWIKDISKLLKPNGFLILTLWTQAPSSTQVIETKDLEKDDYILNWNKNDNLKRFVHVFNTSEAEEIAQKSGLELNKTFLADGKNSKSNIYLILKKR